METAWTKEEWSGALKQVLLKSSVDKDFRNLCLQDGRAAVESMFKKLPEDGAKLTFFEREETHLVELPKFMGSEQVLSEAAVQQALDKYIGKTTNQPCLGTPLTK